MSEEETNGQFLTRLGVDGDLWAKEFCKRFPVMHADAIGWFCNAIEAGRSRGRADAMKELMEGEPDGWCAWNEERKVWHFISDGQAYIYKTRGYKGPLTGGFWYVPVKLVKMEVESED